MTRKTGTGLTEQEIRAALERILAAPDFEASERNRRFLRHVVEEALAGRAERIKAYSIATTVFGRPDDFDPMQDSIVRIEAGRLRRALENYHLRHDEVGLRIQMPKGSYVPFFDTRDAAGPAAPEPDPDRPLHDHAPRLLVENFDQQGELGHQDVARVLTRQLIAALTRFTELFVYGFATSEVQPAEVGELRVDYRILGTVMVSTRALRAEILMKREADGRYVWVQDFERELGETCDPSRIVGLCGEIAGHVARVLALRDGILDSQARDRAGAGPRHFAGYLKLQRFHDYWRSLDVALFEPLRLELEAAIAEDPDFVAAHACLSMLYSNAARYGLDPGPGCADPLGRALDLASRAIRLAPNSSRAHHARAIAEWFLGRTEDSIATLQIAHALNPNDPEILAEMGFRHAMRMNWEVAVPLLREAYARDPQQSGQYRMGLFLYHFAEGRPEKALQKLSAINAPQIAQVRLAMAAAYSALGRMDEARHALDEAGRLSPDLRGRLSQDLGFRQLHPDLIAKILRAIGQIDPGWGAARDKGIRKA
ncbi:tetratricopeptide repeat protein [Paracoccus ravus]|uniref:tetratricopeptide repeat protein n=1 Tax=Paracoccus ravus TaxID=2447760 RepID=UPI00106EB56D|nr:tetratricopeptide repeat protein [Paracoccus ravus]